MKHLLWNRKSESWEPHGPYSKRLVREYELPNGKPKTAYLSDSGQYVVGVAVTESYEEIILVKEFRPGPEKIFIDLPCGTMNDDEDPKDAMARELLEETGYVGNVELVNVTHTNPYSTQLRYTCLIKNCVPSTTGQKLDADEFIEVVKMPLKEFLKDYVLTGKTINSAATFFALEKLGALDLRIKI